LFIIKEQPLAYEINYLVTQPTKTLLTRPHSPTLDSKTANINVKKLTSLKLIVRTMWWYHSTKTAKIFWVT